MELCQADDSRKKSSKIFVQSRRFPAEITKTFRLESFALQADKPGTSSPIGTQNLLPSFKLLGGGAQVRCLDRSTVVSDNDDPGIPPVENLLHGMSKALTESASLLIGLITPDNR